jgi:hypothetical protein
MSKYLKPSDVPEVLRIGQVYVENLEGLIANGGNESHLSAQILMGLIGDMVVSRQYARDALDHRSAVALTNLIERASCAYIALPPKPEKEPGT